MGYLQKQKHSNQPIFGAKKELNHPSPKKPATRFQQKRSMNVRFCDSHTHLLRPRQNGKKSIALSFLTTKAKEKENKSMAYQIMMHHEKTGTHFGSIHNKDEETMKAMTKDMQERNTPWVYTFREVPGSQKK